MATVDQSSMRGLITAGTFFVARPASHLDRTWRSPAVHWAREDRLTVSSDPRPDRAGEDDALRHNRLHFLAYRPYKPTEFAGNGGNSYR